MLSETRTETGSKPSRLPFARLAGTSLNAKRPPSLDRREGYTAWDTVAALADIASWPHLATLTVRPGSGTAVWHASDERVQSTASRLHRLA